ncbi:MAG: ParB/RepB/Spo0J family partition protein [Oscillospiraceae bacterium]|nr:ParB/RepB/Spo0J family partition protein [Oscillospiraceae bacterium]
MARKSGLGKGLDALFQDNAKESKEIAILSINEVEPNRNQPRDRFDEESLTALANSIGEHGVIQPIVVRPLFGGRYQIIAGERRWRACRMVGLKEVPVIIKEVDDKSTMELALIENLQREDLNPIEEAKGYKNLMDNYSLTQDDVAKRVGKSRSAVANALRLLSLPSEVLEDIESYKLSAGQARALLAFGDKERIKEVAKKTVSNGLSVRELEKLSKETRSNDNKVDFKISKKSKSLKSNMYKEIEISMQQELHRKVKIEAINGEHGRLTIDFYSQDELIDIAYALAGQRR